MCPLFLCAGMALPLLAADPGAKEYKSMGTVAKAPAAVSSVGFRIEENRPGLVYELGEEAVFTVTATNGAGEKVASGKVKVTTGDYSLKPATSREVDLSRENPFVLRGTMSEPGFLRFEMTGEGVAKTVRGAAFAPERIRAAGTCPADFDAFWAESKAKLAREVPLDPRLVHVPERSTGAYDFWRVSFATFGGQRVWGFLTVPKDKSKAPFPVRFSISSAGTGRWTWDFENARHQDREINMSFTVHRFEPPTNQPDADRLHQRLAQELKAECGVGSYPVAGLGKSREDAYFYRPMLGIDRAVDWLWARPDVDRRKFYYKGGSQGGGLGIILLGLNRKFTKALLHVPAMMDMLGGTVGRECGFPYLEGIYRKRPDYAAACANAAYYNGAFFASRVTCPIRFSMGFVDHVCPPTGVYAAYNELRVTDRQILHGLYRAHGWWPEAEIWEKWLSEPHLPQEVVSVPGEAPSLLPAGRDFKLVWHDEFNGTALDTSKWGYRTNFWGKRAHWFAAPEDGTVEVKDGMVHLKIKKLPNGQFVSPQLQTGELMWDMSPDENRTGFFPLPKRERAKFVHRYGYYECRFRLQRKPGWWSAFWMQTEQQGCTLDPAISGIEHDIMESFVPGEIIAHCFHMNGYSHDYRGFKTPRTKNAFAPDAIVKVGTDGFHTIGMLWEPDGYTVYVDGQQHGPKVGQGDGEAVSHIPEFILLTTECKPYRGQRMTEQPDAALRKTLDEAVSAGDDFVADFVRVYDLAD